MVQQPEHGLRGPAGGIPGGIRALGGSRRHRRPRRGQLRPDPAGADGDLGLPLRRSLSGAPAHRGKMRRDQPSNEASPRINSAPPPVHSPGACVSNSSTALPPRALGSSAGAQTLCTRLVRRKGTIPTGATVSTAGATARLLTGTCECAIHSHELERESTRSRQGSSVRGPAGVPRDLAGCLG